MMMMTSYEAPGYGAATAPASYLDQYQQHPYAWQFAGLGYQRLQQQQHLQQQQQQQKFEEQFDGHRSQQPPQHAVNVGQHYYGKRTFTSRVRPRKY